MLSKQVDRHMDIHGTLLLFCVLDNFHNEKDFNASFIKALGIIMVMTQ